jgi:hypothetical protein
MTLKQARVLDKLYEGNDPEVLFDIILAGVKTIMTHDEQIFFIKEGRHLIGKINHIGNLAFTQPIWKRFQPKAGPINDDLAEIAAFKVAELLGVEAREGCYYYTSFDHGPDFKRLQDNGYINKRHKYYGVPF